MRRLAVLPLLLLAACTDAFVPATEPATADWPVYKGTPGSASFAALAQINRDNVDRLDVAWTYEAENTRGFAIEANPLVIDGVLYLSSPAPQAVALDAATGVERWRFDPVEDDGTPVAPGVNRGVATWTDGTERRIFFTAGPYLYALDAATGALLPDFGDKGRVDLRKGLGRDVGDLRVTATSPGIVYEDLLIQGMHVGEGPGPSAPGHIRAYDVRTGERRWIFHTIPHPGEFGYETWPEDAWKTVGGANAWAGLSLDAARGIVFAPTGSAAYDHYGDDRIGQNLFANAVLALDAATGERIWHFQTVHHDIWDYDVAAPPNLVTVTHGGRDIDAVAQVTKMGHLFLLDRETGAPLFPVEERPVRQTEVPGEQTWPTQPFPTKPPAYARQGFTADDVTDRTPEAAAYVRETYLEPYGEAALFDPPSFKGDIVSPQFNGGTDWGGAAFDPATHRLYVNASNEPEFLQMVPADAGARHDRAYVSTGHVEIYDNEGHPISKRPWGTLNAIDLDRGEIAWQVPLGTYPALEAQGLPPTGTFNIGGPIVTSGGLVFIGATRDERFRAFDAETGATLWEFQMSAGGYATPATYMVDGRQFVVIPAGGAGKPGTPAGNMIYAFALPE